MNPHLPNRFSFSNIFDSPQTKGWLSKLRDYCFGESNVVAIQTANFTCRDSLFYPVDSTGGAITATIPPALGNVGKKYKIKWYAGGNNVTVSPTGTDTLDGGASVVIATLLETVTYISDGYSNWYADCCDSGGGGGIAGITTKEEGVGTGTAAGVTTLDFVGGGATAVGVGATTTITIPTAAPVDPSYLTLGTNGTLTNERVLTAGTNISFVDTGANGTLTINGANQAPTNATYVTLSNDATLVNERVLTAGTGVSLVDSGAGGTITVNNTFANGITLGQAIALTMGINIS